MYQEEIIEHHGVKGQKWGVRRKISSIGVGIKSAVNKDVARKVEKSKAKAKAYNTIADNTGLGSRVRAPFTNAVRTYTHPIATVKASVKEAYHHPFNTFLNPVRGLSDRELRIHNEVDRQLAAKRSKKIDSKQVTLGKAVMSK